MNGPERTLVLWVPDWPVLALAHEQTPASEQQLTTPVSPAIPVALVAQRRIMACSPEARAEGVRIGLREREAQALCPDLTLHPHDTERDERCFAPVIAAIEQLIPGVEQLRPGLCAIRARGPARYYGGEELAAAALLRLMTERGIVDARVGIADGLFAAEQAARAEPPLAHLATPRSGVHIITPELSAAFLAPLPITRAAEPPLAETLRGLGIRTLGAFAALPEAAVRQRFGPAGLSAHRRARAAAPTHGTEVRPRRPVRDLTVEASFEPPLNEMDRLAFACTPLADRFISTLTEEGIVCTGLRVELTEEGGARHEREWAHPHRFTAADTVDRVRWQAAGAAHDSEHGSAGIAHVRITPTHTDRAASHEPGLWSSEPDARVHHHLSRVQSRLGHTGVCTASLVGGRLLAARQTLVPWGTGTGAGAGAKNTRKNTNARARAAHTASASTLPVDAPWPGSLQAPVPTQVFTTPLEAELRDATGATVEVDTDDLLVTEPTMLRVERTRLAAPVSAWSSPWPVRERWWEGAPDRFRLQVLLENGDAWLLFLEAGHWFAEGRYD